jgi:alpha-galactosidase
MNMNTSRRLALGLLFSAAVAIAAVDNCATCAAEEIPLTSLHLGLEPAPWNLPRSDRSASGRPMQIQRKSYDKGLGTRAGTSYFVALGGAQRFTAEVGVDDATSQPLWRKAQFQVVGDGKVLFDSGVMAGGPAPKREDQEGKPAIHGTKSVDVKLAGVKVLELRVIDHAAGMPPADVDWINATLTVEGARPEAIPCPEDAVILTPTPSAKPRINGAKVFGVRPGAPFLFTIAATGEKPIRFAAEGLPQGLTIDPQSGVIGGTIAVQEPNTYRVTLKARNAQGEAARELRIAVGPQIALTPPLGWNSWNCYAETVDQEKVLATAKAMVAKGLKDHGWTYVNIDDTWQGKRGGPFGGIQGNEKFPDMKGLCDTVHAIGLKVGIYSTPWATSYAKHIGGSSDDKSGAWDGGWTFGAYSFASNDARQWAAWGMDYLKYDWRPTDIQHVREMAEALRASGRDIVYSLSNSSLYDHAAEYARLANCWRTTCDIRDMWSLGDPSGQGFPQGVLDIVSYNAQWQPFAGPGHFNDPDMLVVGKVGWGKLRPTHLTPNEQYTHVSMWCLWSAPLLIGAPVEQLDPFTLNLLGNDEVLEINQDPLCRQAQRVLKDGLVEVWSKPLEDGSLALGLFNFGFEEISYTLKWADLALASPQKVRDLWRQADLETTTDGLSTKIGRHGVVLLKLASQGKGAKPGINEPYRTLSIEQAVKRFETGGRDIVAKRDEIVAACELKPGLSVADVGAGTGLITRPMAAQVGPQGKVYAVDITPQFIEHITKTAQAEGLHNIATILSSPTSAKLPAQSVDRVLVCDTYHHFDYPAEMLASIHQALRPAGRLIVIDRKRADDHVRADQKTVVQEITAAGFKLIDQKDLTEREYLIRFEKQ